jgi:inorganic pyrophosphatase
MDELDNLLLPEINLETDDIIMNIAVKKDYSKIEDLEKRKEEFIKDLKDFIEEFSQTPESLEFMKYYD